MLFSQIHVTKEKALLSTVAELYSILQKGTGQV